MNNKVASIMKGIAIADFWIFGIAAVIFIFIAMAEGDGSIALISLASVIVGFIEGMMFYAFAEIIELLDSINGSKSRNARVSETHKAQRDELPTL